ncbi:MAG: FAD-dependent oxidoreductase, partial [Victivallales bacterium]|nr:FAD-dependent oxidoreductase [Victivallales bacterium]
MKSTVRMSQLMDPVDVLVIGGSCAGVAAAAQAARKGAKTALLAPRAFLGEDLCDNNRFVELPLYADSNDPLLAAISAAPVKKAPLPPTIGFTYTADKKPNPAHPDNAKVPRLSDHRIKNIETESVQFDGKVVITLILKGGPQAIDSVALMMFQRGYFLVEKMVVEAKGKDGSWKQVGAVSNGYLDYAHGSTAMELRAKCGGVVASALRVHIKNPLDDGSMLLSEICVITPELAKQEKAVGCKEAIPYPMTVKRTLDAELLDNGVKFLYDVRPIDVLKTVDGCLGGVVVADRSGVQYVRAKTVIDATENGIVAMLAGAEYRPLPDLDWQFKRYIIGGAGRVPEEGTVRKWNYGLNIVEEECNLPPEHPVWEYTFTVKHPKLDLASIMDMEQKTRDMTWDDDMVLPMGSLSWTAGKRIVCKAACDAVTDVEKLSLDCLRPKDTDNLMVIGRNADVCYEMNEKLQRPDAALKLGRLVGDAAAASRDRTLGKLQDTAKGVSLKGRLSTISMNHRFSKEAEEHNLNTLPVLGTYDVVVVGGGTGGGPAAIGAVRQGAKTLVVEFLNDFGGTSTVGAIASYYYGNICGFTSEMDAGIKKKPYDQHSWPQQGKSEWMRREIRKGGGEIWTETICFGAIVSGSRVVGIAVATPFGPGVVYAKTVVDSTGNADVAAAAGAECADQDSELGVQGVGLSPVIFGRDYVNTDYLFHDDSDVIDASRAFVLARERYRMNPDIIQIIGTRERRRIIGDNVIMPMDVYNHRTYSNTICVSSSNFDSHGYTCHPMFFVLGPDRERAFADVPFGAILPRGIEGIEVTGLAISGHRDTMPTLRMQPDIQNHGYAAGCAAAQAAKEGVDVRYIDIRKLQKHLIKIGCLPKRVLTDKDSYPLPTEVVADAVKNLTLDWKP